MATTSKLPRDQWSRRQLQGSGDGKKRLLTTTAEQRSEWSRRAAVVRWTRVKLARD